MSEKKLTVDFTRFELGFIYGLIERWIEAHPDKKIPAVSILEKKINTKMDA